MLPFYANLEYDPNSIISASQKIFNNRLRAEIEPPISKVKPVSESDNMYLFKEKLIDITQNIEAVHAYVNEFIRRLDVSGVDMADIADKLLLSGSIVPPKLTLSGMGRHISPNEQLLITKNLMLNKHFKASGRTKQKRKKLKGGSAQALAEIKQKIYEALSMKEHGNTLDATDDAAEIAQLEQEYPVLIRRIDVLKQDLTHDEYMDLQSWALVDNDYDLSDFQINDPEPPVLDDDGSSESNDSSGSSESERIKLKFGDVPLNFGNDIKPNVALEKISQATKDIYKLDLFFTSKLKKNISELDKTDIFDIKKYMNKLVDDVNRLDFEVISVYVDNGDTILTNLVDAVSILYNHVKNALTGSGPVEMNTGFEYSGAVKGAGRIAREMDYPDFNNNYKHYPRKYLL